MWRTPTLFDAQFAETIITIYIIVHLDNCDNITKQPLPNRSRPEDSSAVNANSFSPSVDRMLYFISIALLMGNISLYIGEFNSGFTNGTTLSQNQVYEYLDGFKSFASYVLALWR